MAQTHLSSRGMGIKAFFTDIKISHSLFALPFAASSFFISDLPLPGLLQGLYLLIAIVAARSFAMGANRYIDAPIDALNPRTKDRAIPAGKLELRDARMILLFFSCLFIFVSFNLSPLAGWLSFPVLLILAFYGRMKKISSLTHLYLGLCLGLSPIAVGVAISGTITLELLLLSLAVMAWTAGFDILYALQDISFDRSMQLKSIPAVFGVKNSLLMSRLLFILMIALLVAIGLDQKLGMIYFSGVLIVASILLFEHFLVRSSSDTHLSPRINLAFFNANAMVSVIYFVAVWLDHIIPL